MKKKEDFDSIEELFHSNLYDLEMDTMPDDWEKIESRLPKRNTIPFYRKVTYWAAAAVVGLFLIVSSKYLFSPESETPQLTNLIEKENIKNNDKGRFQENKSRTNFNKSFPVRETEQSLPMLAYMDMVDIDEEAVVLSAVPIFHSSSKSGNKKENNKKEVRNSIPSRQDPVNLTNNNVGHSVNDKEHESVKRWKFGMGGGSVSTGTSNSMNTYAFRNTTFNDVELLSSNALNSKNEKPAKTDIDHHVPISMGIGVSYMLNNRFSLESGLTYSYLHSKWKTNGQYHKTTKQKLHFLGIPLSLSYKIAEWQNLRLYAAAGAMAEVNIAGKLVTKSYINDHFLKKESNSIRMSEWYWSVNGRIGVSYPVCRFIGLYAEAGVSYYFDNNSTIETIHSSKPFNVNLQAGFRFNF